MRIDFATEKPDFDNGQTKWYIDKHLQSYIENSQADNLPSLKGLGIFVVKGDNVEDYVLINDKQAVLASFNYTMEGLEQMTARINMYKVSKHYDKHEQAHI